MARERGRKGVDRKQRHAWCAKANRAIGGTMKDDGKRMALTLTGRIRRRTVYDVKVGRETEVRDCTKQQTLNL